MAVPSSVKCKDPICTKMVNNVDDLCRKHRLSKCKITYCTNKVTTAKYCNRHAPDKRGDQHKEYLREI